MLSKGLNDKIRANREKALLPFIENLFRLVLRGKGTEAAVVLASITKISDTSAVTKSHLIWTQKMMDFIEKYPEHEEVINELLRYISDQAAVELAIAGASQDDMDRWDNKVKELLNSD